MSANSIFLARSIAALLGFAAAAFAANDAGTDAQPAPAVSAPVDDAARRLAETEEKLATALRSYAVLQQESDKAREDASKAAAEAEGKLAAAQNEIASLRAQVAAFTSGQKDVALLRQASVNLATDEVELRDRARQLQATVSQLAEENSQLKTRLALLGPPPASLQASPARFASVPAPAPAASRNALEAKAGDVAPAAPAAPAEKRHIVVEGDSLSRIARRYYGSADRWPEIFEANRNILQSAERLPLGASLRIP